MANRTLRNLFDQARAYLDTDELNFPDDLCNLLLQRIWRQAVTMEREWRFLQMSGTQDVSPSVELLPMAFITDPAIGEAVPAERLFTLRWGVTADVLTPLALTEYRQSLKTWGDSEGTPCAWSEYNAGPDRKIRLWPTANVGASILSADFYADLTYPADPVTGGPYDVTLYPLPDEWDDALFEGLLAEMYMREEDSDLFTAHRGAFLEQTGSIRDHWRYSYDIPIVVAWQARNPSSPQPGFNDMGAFKAPAMR